MDLQSTLDCRAVARTQLSVHITAVKSEALYLYFDEALLKRTKQIPCQCSLNTVKVYFHFPNGMIYSRYLYAGHVFKNAYKFSCKVSSMLV
jgi:hypothetical protein